MEGLKVREELRQNRAKSWNVVGLGLDNGYDVRRRWYEWLNRSVISFKYDNKANKLQQLLARCESQKIYGYSKASLPEKSKKFLLKLSQNKRKWSNFGTNAVKTSNYKLRI